MKQHRSLIIWTLIANFLIVIAAGHGIGTLGLLEFTAIGSMLGIDDMFSPDEFFQSRMFYAAIANLPGQLLLITSLFMKNIWLLMSLKLSGLFFLLLAFCLLLSSLWEVRTIIVTIVTGMPFIILSIALVYKNWKSLITIS